MHCRILLLRSSTNYAPAIIVTFTINHIETKKIDALPDLTIAFFHRSRAGNGCSSKDHAPARWHFVIVESSLSRSRKIIASLVR
ncbi:hypothetical protein [Ignatzschineria cameli]|uniref:hypothetical protein n=1 Tax=Ignatzschineria cameli TaxID=2182793 RepID=UPI001057E353|nr:hypothetical protein [Ignatzschineria cameli]